MDHYELKKKLVLVKSIFNKNLSIFGYLQIFSSSTYLSSDSSSNFLKEVFILSS
jgi:hypothetical protein